MTGPTDEVRRVVRDRAQDRCETCGAAGADLQHRRPRQMGGTSLDWVNQPANLLLVCRPCHTVMEKHRGIAYSAGWLIRASSIQTANEVPVALARGMVLLDNGGGITDLRTEAA